MTFLLAEVTNVEQSLEKMSLAEQKESGANADAISEGVKKLKILLENQNLSLQDLESFVMEHHKTMDTRFHSLDSRLKDLENARTTLDEKHEKVAKQLKIMKSKSKKNIKSPSSENLSSLALSAATGDESPRSPLSPRRDSSASTEVALAKFMAEMQEKMEALTTRQALTRASVGVLRGHKGIINQVLPVPSEEGNFVTASSDRQIIKWNGIRCKAMKVFNAESAVTKIEHLSDKMFVTAGGDGNLRLWNWQSDKYIYKQEAHKRVITGLVALPENRLVSCSADGSIRIWSAGAKISASHAFTDHIDAVNGVTLSDGGQLASCSDDRTVRLWDLNQGKASRTLKGETTKSFAVFIDEHTLATASVDKHSIEIWDLRTSKAVRELTGHTGGIRVLQKMNDNVISGGKDGQVLLWNVRDGALKTKFIGHTDWITSILSAGRSLVASSSCDLTVRVWAEDGRCVQIFQGHTGNITQMAFDAPSNTLATSSNDFTVRLWSPNFHQ
jgi:WD40 repeat protein